MERVSAGYRELARLHPERIVKVDADQNPETVTAAGVTSIPTLAFYKGGERVDALIGAHPKPAIAAKLEELLA